MEPRDPSAPGFGLPSGPETGGQAGEQPLVLHPRALAFLWIIPIFLCGLILSSCNYLFLVTPKWGWQAQLLFVALGLLGLVLLLAPLVNFFNAEVRFSKGVVSKRGILRRVQRWEATDLARIHSYVRYVDTDAWAFLNYVVYRFIHREGGIAFELSQAWWKTTDIEALAKRLDLYVPEPSEV